MSRRPVFVASVAACLLASCKRPPPPAPPPTTKPATTQSVEAVSEQPKAEPAPTTVLDVVRLQQPDYSTKRPLDVPADLADAAKIVLDTPAYVDPQGNLWLTHPQGLSIGDALSRPITNHTVVCRETVFFQTRAEDKSLGSAIVQYDPSVINVTGTRPWSTTKSIESGHQDARVAVPMDPAACLIGIRPQRRGEHSIEASVQELDYRQLLPTDPRAPVFRIDGGGFNIEGDFASSQIIPGGLVAPWSRRRNEGTNTRGNLLLFTSDLSLRQILPLPQVEQQTIKSHPALATTTDGVWAWSPWENGQTGSGVVHVTSAGTTTPDPAAGWPDKPVEVIPLADGSVLVVAVDTDRSQVGPSGNASLKLVSAPEKPITGDQLRTVQPLARKLADRDPAVRQATQRELEKMGPSVLPVLEAMREQLPPEAQIRIEAMLGQRFAPTIAGLRLLPGRVRTLARFPGGGCVLRFDGGGTIDADGDTPARSVVPATVLIRPGYPIELIDPESVCDFLPGRQSIQWVGEELLISDPVVGPRRWVGSTLSKPILPKELADFDTVVAIDARRRWLLTSAKRPGKTLLIDPSLPDTTPKLPTWTIAGDAIGRTEAGWPAVKRGDRVFVLERSGWRIDKPAAMRPLAEPLRIVADRAGRFFSVDASAVHGTDVDGRDVKAAIDGDVSDGTPLATGDRLLVYTPDGTVRRFAIGKNPLTLKAEATFTQNVPREATVWIDAAGRLVMANSKTMTVAFPEGRIPRELADLMLNPGR